MQVKGAIVIVVSFPGEAVTVGETQLLYVPHVTLAESVQSLVTELKRAPPGQLYRYW